MNIINYSIESELLGSRQLNAYPNRGRSISGLSKASTDFRSMSNVDNFTRKLPNILREKEYDLSKSQINKIFCAQWLDERRVLMGTKCNKLVTLNTDNGQYSVQEPLKSHRKSTNIQNHCGLHSISINPSRTLLATGAEHVNDIGIYSLPDMKPVSVGYGAHSYWIFDTLWLDDQHVCSGAGDNKLALWKVDIDSIHPRSSKLHSLNSTGGSTSSLSQTSPCSSSSNSKSKIYSHEQQKTSQRPQRACKRQLPASSSLSSLESTSSTSTSTSSTSLSNLYNNFSTTYSMLTQPSSFNSLASSYFRQSVIYPTVPIRYPVRFAHYRPPTDFANNQYQDNNNNISYFNGYYDRDQQAQYSIVNEANETENRHDYNRLRPSFSNSRMTTMQNDNFIDYQDEMRYYLPDQEQDEVEEEVEEEALSEIDEFVWNEPVDEHRNDFPNEHIGSDIDEEDDDDMDSENIISSDESEGDIDDDDDDNNFSFSSKRRRLNSRGKFTKSPVDRIKYNKPTKVIKCKQSKRIRAMAFNPKRNEIAAISMNAAFHYFDVQRFEQKYTKKLSPVLKENVCLAINDDYTIYAIGSASHVQLLDSNNAKQLVNPVFIKKDIGVRSVNFRNNILSIGTGTGSVMFYDLRVHRFLENETDKSKLKLQTNGGWILRNENYYENLPYAFNTDNTHAIYAHSYDPSGTKLLTVGGPLTVNFFGHYAGVWR